MSNCDVASEGCEFCAFDEEAAFSIGGLAAENCARAMENRSFVSINLLHIFFELFII